MSQSRKWRKIPRQIREKLLTMCIISNQGKEYTTEHYEKYILPVAEYDVTLSFFDIPDDELPKIK